MVFICKKKGLLGVNSKVLVKLAYKRVPWREKRTETSEGEGLRWKGCVKKKEERHNTAKTTLAGSFVKTSAKPICRWKALAWNCGKQAKHK